jgi:hypothetical protein
VKAELKLPENVYFGFNNILLETLDKDKSGSSKKNTGSGAGASDATTDTAKTKQDSSKTTGK